VCTRVSGALASPLIPDELSGQDTSSRLSPLAGQTPPGELEVFAGMPQPHWAGNPLVSVYFSSFRLPFWVLSLLTFYSLLLLQSDDDRLIIRPCKLPPT
jgi:hypothetical protein